MQYLTYAEIKNKVLKPTDTEDELFITAAELLDLCHDAIKECEAEIHTLYEDYFLKNAFLALVQGQSSYSLPSDIFGSKIRTIMYSTNGKVYPIDRILDWKKFEQIEFSKRYDTGGENYRYFLTNPSAAGGIVLNLLPASAETSTENVIIFYLRQANKPLVDSDLIDIPEFYSYITTYMRAYIYKKEGHPNTGDEFTLLEKEKANMQATLRSMVPDEKNEAPLDLSFYNDMNEYY